MSEAVAGLRVLRQMHGIAGRERPADWRYHLTRLFGGLSAPVVTSARRLHVARFARAVARERRLLAELEAQALAARIAAGRGQIAPEHLLSPAAVRLVAALAELSKITLGLDPFPSQIRGVAVLLCGAVAEMETGSGKTLTAALAAVAAVHAGLPVHVITANDYLAERDATELEPFFAAAGVHIGLVVHAVPPEKRAAAYRADIVYASNKEIAFDYLRNRIAIGADSGPIRLALESVHHPRARAARLTMRGLPFAIVDEADSVLIDECRTPLIISADAAAEPELAETALELGDALDEQVDFVPDDRERTVAFTDRGRRRLAELGDELGGVWRNGIRREEAARQGIIARRYFQRDEHYIVRAGVVELIDEYTGRIAADRTLGDGLHQVLQAKEGVAVTGRRYARGRITYQRFFRRYGRLAGMTGTAREVASELLAVYGLRVIAVRPHHRSRRRRMRPRLCRTAQRKRALVTRRTQSMVEKGRPVLIATRTILASEATSAALAEAGIEHRMLSATQDAAESAVIAEAGQVGRVTVATNMAGRGVDIRLGLGVREAGGLHVILTELHEAGRIDRQATGRCGRQGDPGSHEAILSWEDPLVVVFGDWRARLRLGGSQSFTRAQVRAERLHARARLDLLRQDQRRERQLSFTGSVE